MDSLSKRRSIWKNISGETLALSVTKVTSRGVIAVLGTENAYEVLTRVKIRYAPLGA
jgi:hypothetical protein